MDPSCGPPTKNINALEKVQRVFTKHIDGMHDLLYTERLKALQIYSLQRRRDRYMAIYILKILEGNLTKLLTTY